MQALLEFAPLVAFFVAYYLRRPVHRHRRAHGGDGAAAAGRLAAPAAHPADARALGACWCWSSARRRCCCTTSSFIQWKPTVFFWLASLAFLGSFWIGKHTLTERFLGTRLRRAPAGDRRRCGARLNGWWVGLLRRCSAALNLAVAHYASERAWVALQDLRPHRRSPSSSSLAQVLWLHARQNAARAEPSADAAAASNAPAVMAAAARRARSGAGAGRRSRSSTTAPATPVTPARARAATSASPWCPRPSAAAPRSSATGWCTQPSAPLMAGEVHALNIIARAPGEALRLQ